MSEHYEVVIIGGGAAGLNAALVLGRSKRNVLVLDENKARNNVTKASHGFLTRDGVKPEEFKEMGIGEIKAYPSVSYIESKVTSLHKDSGLFHIHGDGQNYTADRVIVATGMKDELPDIKGVDLVYGTSVFHCPYCDGWERREEPLAVFGNDPGILDYVKLIYNWSQDLMIFTNGPAEITSEEKEDLKQHGVALIEETVRELVSEDGYLKHVVTESDEVYDRSGGFILETSESQSFPLHEYFDIEFTDMGGYYTKDGCETLVDGLYVIGDSRHGFSGLLKAASEGYELAVALNHELAVNAWDRKG
ncbi:MULTISPECIES: NAD(P)/FAD-dependent oxidoreductase [Pontibacillus]|uniref:NAD(P)/FAD-dependent oxidoreductase n=1 Tax=Pontibacillus chungwhensis TaxID=265426 RepID=A0ABY8UTE9_9BACI|nr:MULTISPECIES: NAD(P)/FAD-dependent oxidoreductase [Pontibacillus]MCD5323312.1 NAD(P)/FAD-dependent oxidoreductase [Pontibacillus sp. HN14]WIF96693.1 NAD(P)/FAD-dependent oxidoreductase [Pontibacillus chungwhensis]